MPLYKSKTGKLIEMSPFLASISNARNQAGFKQVGKNFEEYNRRRASKGGIDYTSFLADFQKRETGAREDNLARETEIRGTYDQLIGQDQGVARTAGLADIERGKTQAIGAGTQQLISSGLYGTTTAASIPVQAENQASLSRLKLEDTLQQRTNQLKLGKAGFVERIEQPYPDYSLLVNAMIAQGKA